MVPFLTTSEAMDIKYREAMKKIASVLLDQVCIHYGVADDGHFTAPLFLPKSYLPTTLGLS